MSDFVVFIRDRLINEFLDCYLEFLHGRNGYLMVYEIILLIF